MNKRKNFAEAAKRQEYNAMKYETRLRLGLCVLCGREEQKGLRTCAACRQKIADRHRRKYGDPGPGPWGFARRNSEKTVCLRGHPFDKIYEVRGKKHRVCRTCKNLRKREIRELCRGTQAAVRVIGKHRVEPDPLNSTYQPRPPAPRVKESIAPRRRFI